MAEQDKLFTLPTTRMLKIALLSTLLGSLLIKTGLAISNCGILDLANFDASGNDLGGYTIYEHVGSSPIQSDGSAIVEPTSRLSCTLFASFAEFCILVQLAA